MAKEANYIPKSAKATDFKITLSKGASEDSERVSFLEQQIQQAKDTYESSLKNVIEECISLETSALQSHENETIYTRHAPATTSTATGLPRLPMRQKPWAGNHRTRRLYKNSDEGPPPGRTNIPTSIAS